MIDAFPLQWPLGWPRAASHEYGRFKGTPGKIRDELVREIDRLVLGDESRTYTIKDSVIISTDVPLRKDGLPYASAREPDDPGVAVYFERKGQQVCFACDKYDRVWKNMRAIQKTIEAMRGIERWGSSDLLDRAFTGFEGLPAPGEGTGANCWIILGVAQGSSEEEIRRAWREKLKSAHPDKGGTREEFEQLQSALKDALNQIKE